MVPGSLGMSSLLTPMFEITQELVVSTPEALAVLCLLLIGVLPALTVALIAFSALAVECIHRVQTAHR